MTTRPDESVYRAAAEQLATLHGHQPGTAAFELHAANDANSPGLRCIVDTAWSLKPDPSGEPTAVCTEWAARLTGPGDMPPRTAPIVHAATAAEARAEYERDWVLPDYDARTELVRRVGVKYSDGRVQFGPWTVVDTTARKDAP